VYYGYRFYNPEAGRWPSRDPIGETDGVNLNFFIVNDSTNSIDALGLQSEPPYKTLRQAWQAAAGAISQKPNVTIREYGAALWAWCNDSFCNSISGYSHGPVTEGPPPPSMDQQFRDAFQGKQSTITVQIDFTPPAGAKCTLKGTIHSHPSGTETKPPFSSGDVDYYDDLQNKYSNPMQMLHYVIHAPTGEVYEYTTPIQGNSNRAGVPWENVKTDPVGTRPVGNIYK